MAIGIGTSTNTDLSKYKLPDNLQTSNLSTNQPKIGIANQQTPTIGIGQASSTQTVTPKVEVPISLSTSQLSKTTSTPQVVDNSGLIKTIQSTLDKAPTAKLNEQGLEGLLKIAGLKGGSRPDLVGTTLKDAINTLGISDKFSNPNLIVDMPPTIVPEATKQPTTTVTPKTGEKISEQNKLTAYDEMEAFVNDYSKNIEQKIDELSNKQGLETKSQEITQAEQNIATIDNQIEAYNLDLISQGEDIKNKPILLGDISQKLSALDDKSKINLMLLNSNRNKALADYNAKVGDYNRASEIVKESAADWKEVQKMKLDLYATKINLDKEQKDELSKKNDDDFAKMEKGFVQISPDQEEKYKQDILSGKAEGSIYTDVYGNKWFKPKSTELSDIELYSQKKAIDALYDAGKISDSERKEMNEKLKSDSSAIEQANSALTYIDEILSSDRLDAITGLSANLPTVRPESVGLVQKVDSLKNLLTLQNLQYLKGAMSDKDIVFITSASSALNRKMSTSAFKEEIQKIKDVMVRTKLKSGAYDTLEDYYYELPQSEQSKIDALQRETGVSDEDLLKELRSEAGGFNSVGGDTNQASIKLGSRLSKVNNNPGNLRYAGQAGASQGEGGFARFETPQAGYEALKNQIKLDASRGLTLEKFINKYAPPSENDTNLYVKQMVKETGASKNTPISNINLETLAKAMAKKESSTIIS